MDAKEDLFVVVSTTYPTSYGCYRGKVWSPAELIAHSDVEVSDSKFQTYMEAVEYARECRESTCHFEGTESLHDDEDDLPPYDSAILGNFDNDDEVLIRVMKQSQIDNEMADDEEVLKEARARQQLDSIVQTEMFRHRVVESGRVHYSTPRAPYDIPAQLEMDESADNFMFVVPKNAGTIQTLMYKGKGSIFSSHDKNEESDLMILLQACTSLKELYLRSSSVVSPMEKYFVTQMVSKAPHLCRTLEVLSVSGIDLSPEAVGSLGQVSSLVRLDMADCFSSEYWEDNYWDDDPDLPYDAPLVECVDSLHNLRRLDLGNGDWESRKYLHNYLLSHTSLQDVEDVLIEQGGTVTFHERNMPEPFKNRSREKAAKKEALMLVNDNANGKYSSYVVKLAEQKLAEYA